MAMSEEEFVDRFRLTKHSLRDLIGEIQEQLPVANDRRGTIIIIMISTQPNVNLMILDEMFYVWYQGSV